MRETASFSVRNRAGDPGRAVALETTLLAHGLPRGEGRGFGDELSEIVRSAGGEPVVVGVVDGVATAGMTGAELDAMLLADETPKVNTSNLGLAIHRGQTAATTVSATMEIAAGAGISFFATGGLGGVHEGYGERLDISSDLIAFTRFPVAVVTSGVKSILDVASTREALESLGVTCVGYRCDRFPAFYMRESEAGLDGRFDEVGELAAFVRAEMRRTGRGVVVCNPIPDEDEIPEAEFAAMLTRAREEAGGAAGRDATPAVLGALHSGSNGRTLAANLALVRSNAALAGALAGC